MTDASVGDDSGCPASWPAENDGEAGLACWLPAEHDDDHYDPEYGRWPGDGAR